MKQKKLLLLTTGGTIASADTEAGLARHHYRRGLDCICWAVMLSAFDVEVQDILRLDSSNMQPEEWEFIARTIDGCWEVRMTAWCSPTALIPWPTPPQRSASSLQGIPIPVVLTGAQLPITHPFERRPDNLRTAFAMAASGRGGVYLAFDRRVILGTRAVKYRHYGFPRF